MAQKGTNLMNDLCKKKTFYGCIPKLFLREIDAGGSSGWIISQKLCERVSW